MDKEEFGKRMGRIIARALSDEAFKERLLADATRTLGEEGIALPPGMTARALENTKTTRHLVIPSKSPARELSAHELASLGGAQSCVLDKELRDAWCWFNGSRT